MAWEQKRNPKVLIGILNRADFVYRDMLKVAFSLWKEPGSIFLFEGNKPAVDISRNIIASSALKEHVEWCFFLDDDVVAPPNAIQRLRGHNLPIVSGLYWRRHPDGTWPEVFKMNKHGIPKPLKNDDVRLIQGQIIECDAVGAGMLLVHRSVLEKMAPTVPKWNITNPDTDEELVVYEFFKLIMKDDVSLSEDVVFCSRAKGLGFKVYCDTALRAGHLYTGMIKYGDKLFSDLNVGRDQ